LEDGDVEGFVLGCDDGCALGLKDGDADGTFEGEIVGWSVVPQLLSPNVVVSEC
jgi:hypothetical protein